MRPSRAVRLLRSSQFAIESLESRTHLDAQPHTFDSVTMKGNGFINGIVFSPQEQDLIYIHTDMGGAYRWEASAGAWKPLNDWSKWNDWPVQNLGVESMAVDPTNAGRVYMAAGTYNSPVAILRSTNKGDTWQRYTAPIVEVPAGSGNWRGQIRANGNGQGRNGGQRLQVDPNLPSTLIYGTRLDGLWRSTDYGADWSQMTSFPVTGDTTGNAVEVGIIFTLFDKSSSSAGIASQTIYAGVSTSASTKIYRSTDGGMSWYALPNQPSASNLYPIRAAITPDGTAMYVTYADNPGPNGATTGNVYKVQNPGGASPNWSTLPLPVLSSGGWSGVTIDASNASRLLVSTLDRWGAFDDIYRSTDSGATWKPMNMRLNVNNSSAPYANSQTPHWLGDVQIDPFDPSRAMVTTGYGLYSSNDITDLDSNQTVTWDFFNEGFEQSAVLELSSPLNGGVRLFSAIGDRDGFRHADFNVSPPEGRLGQNNGLAAGTSDDIDSSDSGEYLVRSTRVAPWVQYSNDGGITWNWFSTTNTTGSGSSAASVEISADGTRAVYEPGGTGRARYATRTGASWSSWITPAAGQPANGARIVSDAVDSLTFYAISGTTVARSTNGGVNWSVVTTSAPASLNWVRGVLGQTGHLVASTGSSGNGVWRSTNGGATWSRLASSAVTHALAVGVGKAAPGRSYAALFVAGMVSGRTGFFRSDDEGATWIEISDDAHQYGYITVIQGDPQVYGRLYIGTNGRGVIFADIADAVSPTVLQSGFDVQTAPNKVTIQFSENVAASLTSGDLIVLPSGGGSMIAASLINYDTSTNSATFTLESPLADGDYTARLAAGSVSDSAGNALVAAHELSFFSMAGDATRDRSVNLDDFTVLAAHFGQDGCVFGEGDFNYDSTVNLDDFTILASKFGQSLPSDAPAARVFAVRQIRGAALAHGQLLKQMLDEDVL